MMGPCFVVGRYIGRYLFYIEGEMEILKVCGYRVHRIHDTIFALFEAKRFSDCFIFRKSVRVPFILRSLYTTLAC